MNIEQAVLKNLRELPTDKQQEVRSALRIFCVLPKPSTAWIASLAQRAIASP